MKPVAQSAASRDLNHIVNTRCAGKWKRKRKGTQTPVDACSCLGDTSRLHKESLSLLSDKECEGIRVAPQDALVGLLATPLMLTGTSSTHLAEENAKKKGGGGHGKTSHIEQG